VKVERLGDVNPLEAAQQEGVFQDGFRKTEEGTPYPLATMKARWNARYEKKGLGWETSPWVWVYEVRKL